MHHGLHGLRRENPSERGVRLRTGHLVAHGLPVRVRDRGTTGRRGLIPERKRDPRKGLFSHVHLSSCPSVSNDSVTRPVDERDTLRHEPSVRQEALLHLIRRDHIEWVLLYLFCQHVLNLSFHPFTSLSEVDEQGGAFAPPLIRPASSVRPDAPSRTCSCTACSSCRSRTPSVHGR